MAPGSRDLYVGCDFVIELVGKLGGWPRALAGCQSGDREVVDQ
jgi:hypothetical protein